MHLSTNWPPAVYLITIVFGLGSMVIASLFLVETKNVELDDVTLSSGRTDSEIQLEKKAAAGYDNEAVEE